MQTLSQISDGLFQGDLWLYIDVAMSTLPQRLVSLASDAAASGLGLTTLLLHASLGQTVVYLVAIAIARILLSIAAGVGEGLRSGLKAATENLIRRGFNVDYTMSRSSTGGDSPPRRNYGRRSTK